MSKPASIFIWSFWLLLSLAAAAYFLFLVLFAEDKSDLLIGETSYGHYQIELSCSSCHTDAFGGEEAIQQACVNCHGDDLTLARDSHPRKKFTDPREAYRLEIIDARFCVSCHTEHQEEQTNAMGVTLPDDYCFHCHQEIGKDRPSHVDLPYDSCASAGCHNFHDNRALYEDFLVQNADQPWLNDMARISSANHASLTAQNLQAPAGDENKLQQQYPLINQQWSGSAHARADVSCASCHSTDPVAAWTEKPAMDICSNCHDKEAAGFLSGKHGMRLSPDVSTTLSAISPSESPLSFTKKSMDAQHGCSTCHNPHDVNTQTASVDACLECHNDQHSIAFEHSAHGRLWKQATSGELAPEQAVSCASCHLPRIGHSKDGTKFVNEITEADKDLVSIRVEHNQNFYLRPNEKMIRPVCMQCHSLEFSIDALADSELIKSNFNGKPARHIESIDWARKREPGEND